MILLIKKTIVFSLFFIVPRAFIDKYLINKGYKIYHPINAMGTIFVVFWYAYLDDTFLLVPYLFSLYWFVFDPLLNKLRRKELLFVGTTAWLDKSFRKLTLSIQMFLFDVSYKFRIKWILNHFPLDPGKVMLAVKIICVAISIGAFVYFKK